MHPRFPFGLLLIMLLKFQPGLVASGTDHPSIHQQQLETGYPDLLPPGGIPPRLMSWTPSATRLTCNLVGFIPYWMGDSWENIPTDLVSHICWFALELNGSGGFDAEHGWPNGPLVDYFHTGGVPVLVTATLFNGGELETLLGSSVNRSIAGLNLLDRMRAGNADGVMIDFEQLPSSMYSQMTLFMNELHTLLDQAGDEDERVYRLMACTPAVDWGGSYNYSGLSDCCDALFIMAYNYYWSGSGTTGPVAAATGWGSFNVEWSIADHLTYNGNRPEKLILGMPWYGLDWPAVSDQPAAATSGTGTARTYAAARQLALEQGWQRETVAQTPWTPYLDSGWRQCWHEDTVSLGEKYDLVDSYDLQGAGVWALGYQGAWSEVWTQINARYGNAEPPVITDLQIELTGNAVRLSWSELEGADAYMIYASTDALFSPSAGTLIATQTATTYEESVSTLQRFYRVVGVME